MKKQPVKVRVLSIICFDSTENLET
jgi:hypothetical protein